MTATVLLLALALTPQQRADHALNRLAFGARPGEVERVAKMGVDRWIDQQLHPERIDDSAVDEKLKGLPTLKLTSQELARKFYEARRDKDKSEGRQVLGDLMSQRIIRAVDSERQLNEVMVDFWMNHFNVFAGKGPDRFLIASYERDTVRPNVWGRFEDLLMATAKSPAMLIYLDNARSNRTGVNEN